MLVLKGSEAAARIKKEVQEMVEGLGGHVPTAAIVLSLIHILIGRTAPVSSV